MNIAVKRDPFLRSPLLLETSFVIAATNESRIVLEAATQQLDKLLQTLGKRFDCFCAFEELDFYEVKL